MWTYTAAQPGEGDCKRWRRVISDDVLMCTRTNRSFFFFYLVTGCDFTHKPSILCIGIFTLLRINSSLCTVCKHIRRILCVALCIINNGTGLKWTANVTPRPLHLRESAHCTDWPGGWVAQAPVWMLPGTGRWFQGCPARSLVTVQTKLNPLQYIVLYKLRIDH